MERSSTKTLKMSKHRQVGVEWVSLVIAAVVRPLAITKLLFPVWNRPGSLVTFAAIRRASSRGEQRRQLTGTE